MKVEYERPYVPSAAKREKKLRPLPTILFLLFLAGVLLGKKFVMYVGTDYGISYERNVFPCIFHMIAYHVPIVLSTFSPLGLAVIPVTVLVRGFGLSSACALLWDMSSEKACCMHLIASGMTLPAFFLLSEYSLGTALGMIKHDPDIKMISHRNRFLKCLFLCSVSIVLSAVFEWYL